MSIVVRDTFTGTAGTELSSHVGETGATWVQDGVISSADFVLSSTNQIRGNAANFSYYYASGTPSSAEYDVDADFHIYTDNERGFPLIFGRGTIGSETNYNVIYDPDNDWWALGKTVAGTLTLLASYTFEPVLGATYHVKLELRNASKKFYIDTVERGSSADNAVTGVGVSGVAGNWADGIVPTDSTTWHLDNFIVTDLAGSPSVSPSVSPSSSKSPSASTSPSVSPSASKSPSASLSASPSASKSPSASLSSSPSPSIGPPAKRIMGGGCG